MGCFLPQLRTQIPLNSVKSSEPINRYRETEEKIVTLWKVLELLIKQQHHHVWSEEIEREMRNTAKEGKRGIGSFGVCDCGLKKLRERE